MRGFEIGHPLLSKETWECLGPALGADQIFDFEVKILNDFTDRLGRSNVNHDRNEELAVNPGVLRRTGQGRERSALLRATSIGAGGSCWVGIAVGDKAFRSGVVCHPSNARAARKSIIRVEPAGRDE